MSQERFQEMLANHEFLEHAQVFDNCYGTGVRTVQEALANGEQLLLEIDWQGARQVRSRIPRGREHFHPAAVARGIGATPQGAQHRLR